MDLPEDHPNTISLADTVLLPESALRFTYARSSGPGGQNVNKVNTKATLVVEMADLEGVMPTWAFRQLPKKAGHHFAQTRLIISSDESRSQKANREACIAKLRSIVERAMKRPKVRKKRKPTKAMIQRRIDEKKSRGKRKAERRTNRSSDDST